MWRCGCRRRLSLPIHSADAGLQTSLATTIAAAVSVTTAVPASSRMPSSPTSDFSMSFRVNLSIPAVTIAAQIG